MLEKVTSKLKDKHYWIPILGFAIFVLVIVMLSLLWRPHLLQSFMPGFYHKSVLISNDTVVPEDKGIVTDSPGWFARVVGNSVKLAKNPNLESVRDVSVSLVSPKRDNNPPRIKYYTASKYSINKGESITLSWYVENASYVEVYPFGKVTKVGTRTASPTSTQTYRLTAMNRTGMQIRDIQIEVLTVTPATPTATFSASPANINYGSSSVLSWTTTDASTVSIDNGIGNVYPSSSLTVRPTTTTTYTLTATNTAGNITKQATVTVVPPPLPTATISANPATITYGANQSSTLSWSTTDAASVTIDQNIGTVGASGTRSVSPTATTIYTLTATNITGTVTQKATITVVMPPLPTISSFSATPASITYGANQSSTLSWTTTDATTIAIDQNIGTVASSGTKSVSPTATTTYTITATNFTGTTTKATTVTVVKPPLPTATITATPTSITAGTNQTSTLSWSTTDAASVVIDQGIGTVGTSGTKTVSPTTTTTYTLTATNVTGTTTKSTTVTVVLPPPPTASISANPAAIAKGASSTLSWSTAYATTISIDQGIGTVSASGTRSVSPTTTTTYTITASNIAATITKSVTLTVYQPPTATFTADPITLIQGASSTLSWTTTNATSATLDGASIATSGTKSVTPQATTTYTLVATGPGGSVTETATVTVTPPPALPTINSFTASPTSITSGSSATLSWNIAGATSASINQGVGTVSATSGTKSVSPTATTTYTLTATNATGSKTADVTVTVGSSVQTFNVLNYGAKGDGVNDDAAAIQKAYNAAHDANGGIVYFPSGKTFLVNTIWATKPIKVNDYFTKNANGEQVWSNPTVYRTGKITMSGYGATIKFTGTGRIAFLHTDWTTAYWSTYGKVAIEGFTFDNNNSRPSAMAGRIYWHGGAGNAEDITVKDVKLINVPSRISTEYGGVNGVLIRADWTLEDRNQPRWGYMKNITVQDSEIQAQTKPIVINMETPSVAYGSAPGLNQYMIDNVLVDKVKTDNMGYYGSSVHIGSAAAGKSVIVRNSDMRNSSDDGLEINNFDSVLVENNTFSSQRQAICLVWFGYPYSATPPTVTLRNNKYIGDLGAYWPQSTATKPADRAPMIPEARAYTTDNQLKDRSWGNLIIDGGDFEFGVTEEWGIWRPTLTIGSNSYPMSSVTIKNVKITADGPNDGDFISIQQGSQLGTRLPVIIENVMVRRNINNSYAAITSADISTSGAVDLSSGARVAPNLPDRGDMWSSVSNFFTEVQSAVVNFFEKIFSIF